MRQGITPSRLRRPSTAIVLVAVAAAIAAVTGCGRDDAPAAAVTTTARGPLAPEDRLATSGEMAGLAAGPVRRLDLDAYAARVGEDPGALRAGGFEAAAAAASTGADGVAGASEVVQLTEVGRARQQVKRVGAMLLASPPPGADATPLAAPGIPGAVGVTVSGVADGRRVVSHDLLFADGSFVYILRAFGPVGTVTAEDAGAGAEAL